MNLPCAMLRVHAHAHTVWAARALIRSGWGAQHGTFGAWHPSTRAAPPIVWQVVDLPAPEGPLDQPTEELIARIQAELDEAARA